MHPVAMFHPDPLGESELKSHLERTLAPPLRPRNLSASAPLMREGVLTKSRNEDRLSILGASCR